MHTEEINSRTDFRTA